MLARELASKSISPSAPFKDYTSAWSHLGNCKGFIYTEGQSGGGSSRMEVMLIHLDESSPVALLVQLLDQTDSLD